MSKSPFNLFLTKDAYDANIDYYVPFNPLYAPHALILGSSGSGKTFASILWLAKLVKYANASLLIADFKGDSDFSFLNDCANFYRFDKVGDVLDTAIKLLENRQNGIDTSKTLHCMFFDEWASYLNFLPDKKTKDFKLQQMSRLLMLGRSFNIQVYVAVQRGDAEYFNKTRDNFGTQLILGKLTKEIIGMTALNNYKDEINLEKNHKKGHGYLHIDGIGLKEVFVQNYDRSEAESLILSAVNKFEPP